jgi:hypothetical protein
MGLGEPEIAEFVEDDDVPPFPNHRLGRCWGSASWRLAFWRNGGGSLDNKRQRKAFATARRVTS